MTKIATAPPMGQPGQQPSKRKPHRRGGARALQPTGSGPASTGRDAPERQCVACRASKPTRELMQLRDLAATLLGAKSTSTNRHAYVCLQRACLQRLGERMTGGKSNALAGLAFLAQLSQLATTRLTGIIGLARRQGILVMGAARIVANRPVVDEAFVDDADYDDDDDDIIDDDDVDDDDTFDDEDDDDDDADGADVLHKARDLPPSGHKRAAKSNADVILLAQDAAPRTVRSVGPVGRPCMLRGADMGHAAGGAPVAAVSIPAGRLALQAAYWLQVWYEARLADDGVASDVTTPESMIN